MSWTPKFGRGLKLGIVAIVTAASACTDQTPKEPPKVELSDGNVVITSTRNAAASVRYRIIQGRPRAGKWYTLSLTILAEKNNRGFDLYSGDASGLSTEGTFRKEFTIEPPGKPWTPGETVKYYFVLYEGASKDGRSSGISNKSEGQTQVP